MKSIQFDKEHLKRIKDRLDEVNASLKALRNKNGPDPPYLSLEDKLADLQEKYRKFNQEGERRVN